MTPAPAEPMPSHSFCWECCVRNHYFGCEWPCPHKGLVPAQTEEDLFLGYRSLAAPLPTDSDTVRPYPLHVLRKIPKTWLAVGAVLLASCASFVVGITWDGRGTRNLTVEDGKMALAVTTDEAGRAALGWLFFDKAVTAVECLRIIAERDDDAGKHARLSLSRLHERTQ